MKDANGSSVVLRRDTSRSVCSGSIFPGRQDVIVAEDVGVLSGLGAPRADCSSLAMWKADVQLGQDGRAHVHHQT